jgi:HEAT repeat protein
VSVVRSYPNANLRQLAAVEARSLVGKFWGHRNNAPSNLGDDVKQQIKESLLLSATQDEVPIVRHSAARVVSAIARIELPVGLWQDLPGILLQAAGSPKSDDREVATYVLYTLLETLEENMASSWKDFLVVFSRTINDPESMSVRLNTLLALGKMTEILNSEEHPQAIPALRELIPPMVAVLKQVAEEGDEEKSNSAFEVFQMLLIVDPVILSTHFRDLVSFFSDLSVNKDLDDDTRTKALSFLISCLRYKKLKIQSLKVGPALTKRALGIVAEFKDIEDDDEMTPSRTALQLLELMASALPPSMVVVPLLDDLPNYVNSPDPEFRKAGILALGHCVEGAPDFIVTQLEIVFPAVLRLLGDPEARVRQAALEALMQLADDLHDELGKEHARLIPLLINMMDSAEGPEIWRRACNAIDAVLVGVEQEDVQNYLPVLIPKLSQMSQADDYKIKAASIGAIGSTALAAKDSFIPYFQEMMHGLSPYVQLKHSEEELDLRGITIDCMSSIAEAVGMQPFTPYVQPLMQAAEESLQLGHPRMKETAFMFFGTIARIYGEEFEPFLAGATRALFESLAQNETDDFDEGEIAKVISIGNQEVSGEVVAMDGDDDDEDEEDNWEEFNSVSAIAFEKEVAAETLGEILTHCKHGFLPYLEKTVEILKEKANHHYEGVRKAAVSTLWRAYATVWQVFEEKGMAPWQKGLPLAVQPAKELQTLGGVVVEVTLESLKTEADRQVPHHSCATGDPSSCPSFDLSTSSHSSRTTGDSLPPSMILCPHFIFPPVFRLNYMLTRSQVHCYHRPPEHWGDPQDLRSCYPRRRRRHCHPRDRHSACLGPHQAAPGSAGRP